MRIRLLFLFVIVALFSINLSAQTKMSDAKLSREFVGVWQDAPHVAAGMSNLYRFYGNGNFKFETSQMAWSKRERAFAGKWQIKDGKLILTITNRTEIVGGRKVKTDEASGSGDIYEIVGGKTVTRKIKPAKIETYKLGKLQNGEMSKFIKIGNVKFWRLSKNPKDYAN